RAQVLAGVVVHDDGEVDAAVEILLDRLDHCALSGQGQVQNVRPAARPQADAIPLTDLRSADVDALHGPALGPRVPLRHGPPSPAGRRPRIAPWRPSIWSDPMPSVRASSARARSSTAAIACFSSSVSVRIRSVSISSISAPSKKSPGLSGATRG